MATIQLVRANLRQFYYQSDAWAVSLVLFGLVGYILAFAAAAFANDIVLVALGTLATGPMIAFLFRIAHDCGHESHFQNRRANHLLGFICLLPSWHPHSMWLLFHNGYHHGFTNLRGRDYIWVPFSPSEYANLPRWRQMLEFAYRTTPGFGLYYFVEVWLLQMIVPRKSRMHRIRTQHVRDSTLTIFFAFLQFSIIGLMGATLADIVLRAVLAIAFPYAVFSWLVGFASFLNHTHPDIPWFDDRKSWSFDKAQMTCGVHMSVPKWMVFFTTDVGLHATHHIDPRIPIWGLQPAKAKLAEVKNNQFVNDTWTFAKHRSIVKTCKLYDYNAQKWVPFPKRSAG